MGMPLFSTSVYFSRVLLVVLARFEVLGLDVAMLRRREQALR